MARLLPMIVALCVVACGDTSASGGETSDGENTTTATDPSTDGTGSSETGTGDDTDVEWPECEEPEDLPIIGLLVSQSWPWADPPEVEHAICSIDALDEEVNGAGLIMQFLVMTCTHPDSGEHTMRWSLGEKTALAGRIEQFVGMQDLEADFEQYWHFFVTHDNITLRDPNGTLLLASTAEEPSPGPEGWDGTPIGGPAGWEDQAAWFAPLESFVLRDDLCPEGNSDFTSYPGGIAVRLGIELVVEGSHHLLLDRTQLRDIATDAGTYDVLVGSAWRLIEASCSDCPQVYANFLIIRTGE